MSRLLNLSLSLGGSFRKCCTAYANGINSSQYIFRQGQQHVHDPVMLLSPKEYESVFQSFQSDRLWFGANLDINIEYGVAKRRSLAKNHERRMLTNPCAFLNRLPRAELAFKMLEESPKKVCLWTLEKCSLVGDVKPTSYYL